MYVTGYCRPRSTSFASLAVAILFVCAATGETVAQVAPCFPVEPTPPWTAGDLDLDTPGASRPTTGGGAGDYELCSQGGGFGGNLDAYRYLSQAGDGDVTLLAIVDSIDPSGEAGLVARQDERLSGSAHVRIVVTALTGGAAELRSAVRIAPGEDATDGGTAPVSVTLPILLKIERRGATLTTHYDAGDGFVEHLSFDAAGTDLELDRLKYCLAQTSNQVSLESTARFLRASLTSDEEPLPGIDCYPDDIVLAFEGEAEITLKGFALEGIRAVTVAGVDAAVVDQSTGELTFRVPPRARGGSSEESGDIVLESDHHKVVLPQSVVFAGRKYIRGDANSDGTLDLSDGVYILQFLFLGGPGLECPESGDVNDDDKGDLSDAVFLLQFLFLGGARIPAPHPDPGVDPDGDVCGFPPEPVWEGLTRDDGSAIGPEDTLGEGDVVALGLSGLGASAAVVDVLFGDTGAEVLEGSTPERLRLRIGRVPTAGRKCPLVFEKSGVEAGLPPDLAAGFPYSNVRGRALDVDPEDALPESCPSFRPSEGFDLVGSSRFRSRDNGFFLEVDRRLWSSSDMHRVELRVFPPLLAGGSRGPRLLRFDFTDPPPVGFRGEPDGDEDYARWLSGLARRIRVELAGGDPRASSGDDCGGGDCDDMDAEADPEGGGIGVFPCGGTATHVSPYPNAPGPDPGPPGPGTKLKAPKPPKSGGILIKPQNPCQFAGSPQFAHRQTAWCRLAQITAQHVNTGLPIWESFAPRSAMFNAAGLNETKQPHERPVGEKYIMFNMPAFIHFRFAAHYNIPCVPTQNYLACGSSLSHWMSSFPRDAMVVKTFWLTLDYLPESADIDDYYSYQPPSSQRQYLVGMHLNTKDPPGVVSITGSWFWATFFVPPPPADTLDKMGRPLSDRFHTACGTGHRNDIPIEVQGVWRNFVLCVGDEGSASHRCGNPWGPKDECLEDTCNDCHATRAEWEYPTSVGSDNAHQFQWMSSLRTSQTDCYNMLKPLIEAGEPTPYTQFQNPGCE